MTTTLHIGGLRGAGAGVLVDDVVEELTGVESCRTDARRARVVVTHDPEVTSAAEIVAALLDAGYDARVEAEPSDGGGSGPRPVLTVVRRSRRVLWAAVAVAAPLALLVVVLGTRPPAATRAAESPLVGKPAPDVEAETIDGDRFRLSDRRGRWVLVNFFATWCVPCRTEHPELVRFHEAHRDIGDAEVVGIVYDDSAQAVRAFRRSEGGSWPMLVDPKGRIALDFGVAGVPESYLLRPDGIVAAKVVGGVRAADLERLLAQAKQPRT